MRDIDRSRGSSAVETRSDHILTTVFRLWPPIRGCLVSEIDAVG